MGLPAIKSPEKAVRFSVDEYLLSEQDSEGKSEFTEGILWAVAGATPAHNELNYNFNQVIGS